MMIHSLAAGIRARQLAPTLKNQAKFYEAAWTPDAMQNWQLAQFNQQWKIISQSVPYFQELKTERKLPAEFSNWKEFSESMPVMDRKTLQNHQEAFMNKRRSPDYWVSTGGSTAEPIQVPVWRSQSRISSEDIWFARSWFDVKPSDKLFLIWGHSHLLGSGMKARWNGTMRRVKDSLLGYQRWSAYDLSETRLREAAATLLDFQPSWIIGYSVALDQFVRANQDLRPFFRALNLKLVIATAESFPRRDSAQLVSDVLGCPVAMEYGAVETGPLAHQKPNGSYTVFWRHYFLETFKSKALPGHYEILVTSLYSRCLPLVRYKIGDVVSADVREAQSLSHFKSVTGRCNDFVQLRNSALIHSEAFSHVVKDFPSINVFQIVQTKDGLVKFSYVGPTELKAGELTEIRRRLKKIHPELERIPIQRVQSLEKTIAGKTRRIFRE